MPHGPDSLHSPRPNSAMQPTESGALSELNGQVINGVAQPYPVEDDEINLKDLWLVLVRRRWIVMIFLFVVVLSVVIATFLTTPTYRAALTLQIDRESAKVLKFQEVQPEGFNERDFYQTQYELLKSRTLIKRVIDEMNLDRSTMFKNDFSSKSGFSMMVDSVKSVFVSEKEENEAIANVEDVWVDAFLSRLTIAPVKNSRLVKLHYDSASPELAARIVNVYARNFIAMNLERRFEASSYAKSFIEDRLSDVKARVEDSEKKLVEFARKNEIINLSNQENINTQKLRNMNNALSKAEQDRIGSEAKFLQTLKSDGEGLPEILNSKIIQQLKETRTKYKAEYREQLKIFKPGYPTMVQLKEQMNEIQNQIDDETRNIRSAIKMSYETQLEKEKKLRESLETIKKDVLALQDRSIQYNILKREVDTSNQLYAGLLQRMKEVGVAGGVSTNNIFIVDAAEVPRSKHKPKTTLNIALGIIIGLMGGVFVAFLIDYLDDTIKQADELERNLQIPVLGLIPEVQTSDIEYSLGLQSHYDSMSLIAEAYRSVRTSLMFSTSEGAPEILLLTSSAANEGKTTSAINMATAFAQLQKRVLLIDGDLRNPSVHQALNIDNDIGLTNYLTSSISPVRISMATEIDNLFVIPAGPVCPNPAELLGSQKMNDLLNLAREKFDYVVIDGPPVLGLADALVLGDQATGVVLIVEMGGTRQAQLLSTVKRLKNSSINLLGGVLTKVKSDGSGYDYYNNYYYYQSQEKPLNKLPV